MRVKRSLADRFWSKVLIGEPSECWPWQGARRPVKGEEYGTIYGYWDSAAKKRVILGSHRVAYELTHGPIPAGMLVRHSCDNPQCCNPAHLVLGDAAENMHDRGLRGRTARHAGTSNGRAILTFEKATQIRRLHATGAITFRALARAFGVHETQISRIVRNLMWTSE